MFSVFKTRNTKPLFVVFVLALCCLDMVQAQNKKPNQIKEDTIIDFKDRWSFRTNAVGWLMTVPNAAVEFDLSNSVYNKLTLGLEGKYNGYTSHNYLPYIVFNYWEVKPEIRKYWRTEYRAKTGHEPTLREKLFSRQRENPRYWRAYYLGGYLNAGGYDLKFSEEGVRGNYIGAGVTAGYSIPLYSYKKGNIDLELGGSLGLMLTKNNKFKLDRENNAYIPTSNVRNWHIVPFPIVSDLRVAFVFRFKSIKDKYKRIDYEKIQRREAERLEKQRVRDSIRAAEHLQDSLQEVRDKFIKDSISNAKKLAKEQEKIEKANSKNEKVSSADDKKQKKEENVDVQKIDAFIKED